MQKDHLPLKDTVHPQATMWRGPRTITPTTTTSSSCSLNSASTSDHLGLQSSSTRRPSSSLKMRTSSNCWIIAVAVLFCVVTANLVGYAEAQKGNYCRDGREFEELNRKEWRFPIFSPFLILTATLISCVSVCLWPLQHEYTRKTSTHTQGYTGGLGMCMKDYLSMCRWMNF